MESEKIKKGLECCSMLMDNTKTAEEQDNACVECPYQEKDRCSWKLDADALTLINELESENEKLSAKYKNLENNYEYTHKVYREYEEENKQLKDRLKEFIKG